MSIPQEPTPARLVVSIIFATQGTGCSDSFIDVICAALEQEFGKVNFVSSVSLFTQTDYYEQEMGERLSRIFISFEKLQPRAQLAPIKLLTNALELRFSRPDGTRQCNIDPGFLTVENFILATGKNFTHRIYLKEGIFSEVTLLFQGGKFQTLPWTYWDYAAGNVVEMLTQMRKALIAELKSLKLL
nr:DUF4416 family protein [Desulfobulbaceae bacterium]